MADRKARLAALRAAAEAEGEVPAAPADAGQTAPEEPVLKFRNYAVMGEEAIQHEKVAPAPVPEFEEVVVDAEAVGGDDPEEVLVNVAPKKANWDLRRDIASKLSKLERRTQTAMIKLMQQEEQRRQQEEGGE